MDRSEIEAKLTDLLVDELGIERDRINMDAAFEEDLEVDSLGVVELLMALEDNFGVKIPDEEAEQIGTVGQAAEIAVAASELGTDVLFVGGSTGVTSENLDATVLAIKGRCGQPVVFFARSRALSAHCDAILVMSILNSRNLK